MRDRGREFGEYSARYVRAADVESRANEGADFRDFLAILRDNGKFIVATTLAALLVGLAYVAISPTIYTATVSVLIDARPRLPVGADPQANPVTIPDLTLVESQVKLIGSDTVLRRVVEAEKLMDDPDYVASRPGLRARLMAMLGLGSAPRGEDRASRAVAALSRSVAVKRSERTYIIDLDLSAGDPNKAARLANLIAEAYITDQRDARSQTTREDSKWLNTRLLDLQTRLQDAENRVQDFRAKNRITDAGGKNMREQEFSDLTNELGRARARLIEARAKYDLVQRIIASGRAPDATSDALKSPVLEKLRVQYAEIARQEAHYRTTLGDRHPALLEVQNQLRDSRQLIAAELKRIAEASANEYQQARGAEAETARRMEGARQQTDVKNQTMVQLRDLEREVEAQRGVYERFLRAREHGFDENRDPPNARIITPASPPLAPSAPKTLAIVFIALAAGLSFSVGAALLRDYFVSHAPARRERDPDPDGHGPGLDGDAPLPVIVETPRIAGAPSGMSSLKRWMSSKADAEAADAERGLRDPLRESADHPDSLFGQAIETLRAELTRGRPSRRARHPLKVLLNSEKSGAGKTTIAINLAWSAARAGLRTLVMEANPDSPALGALVGEDASLGLLELDGELRSIHRIDEELHLWVLLIDEEEGEAPRDLTERARAARFSGLSGNFDLVIIDGPSIEADETARLLASAADKIVLVTGPGESPPGVDYLVEALDVPQSKLSGAVLANSKPGRAA